MTSSSGRSDARPRASLLRRLGARLPFLRSRATIARYEAGIAHLVEVCQAASRGDLEARAQGIEALGAIARTDGAPDALLELAERLNHVLDLSDAYVRESQAALEAARDGRFY